MASEHARTCPGCIQRIAEDTEQEETVIVNYVDSNVYRTEVIFEETCQHNTVSCLPSEDNYESEDAIHSIAGVAFLHSELSLIFRFVNFCLSYLDIFPKMNLREILASRKILPLKIACNCGKKRRRTIVDGGITCFLICRHQRECPVAIHNKTVISKARRGKKQLGFLAQNVLGFLKSRGFRFFLVDVSLCWHFF